jgi:hypothetical protein
MTTDQIASLFFIVGIAFGYAIPALTNRRIGKKLRPRVIVTISQTCVSTETRRAFYTDMMRDTDRDYVIVAAQTDIPVSMVEIR